MYNAVVPVSCVNVVLDDDPTGVQAVHDVPVLLRWSAGSIRKASVTGARSIHLMTNIRALAPQQAEAKTFGAVAAALAALPESRIVLRGDSTLRGHLREEYRAVHRAARSRTPPVLLLVPALPAAGRVTLDGIHWITEGGRRLPLHETEYARDGAFSYRTARLLDWAEERTAGEIAAADGTELSLAPLRAGGPAAVGEAILRAAASGRPAACAPDAETLEDLAIIAKGLERAEAEGANVLVRCAPTFAGVLAGTLAEGFIPAPQARERGLLIVCGSYVPGTSRQLAHLQQAMGINAVEPDIYALASEAPHAEVGRVAAIVRHHLTTRGVALVSTPRERPAALVTLDAGERIARGLASVVAMLDPPPDVLIAKGGITSHVVLEHGLRVSEARVAGPVAAGIALWNVRSRGSDIAYLVFPGNVGGADHLTSVVSLVQGR